MPRSQPAWDRSSFKGTELFSKTLGVFGFGRIGQLVAARAQAFDMQIVAYDKFVTAGAVHDSGTVAHPLDGGRIDEVDGLRRLRQVQRDEVGARVQLRGVIDPVHAELSEPLRGDELVVGDDLHVEGLRTRRDQLADPAEAEHAKGLAVELRSLEARAVPPAGRERGMSLRDVPAQRQHQRQRVLRGGDRVRLGSVGDDDAPLGGGLDVDVVHPGAGATDHLQPLPAFDQVGRELGCRPDQDPVEFADPLLELVAVPVEAQLDVELLLQELDAGVGDLLLDENLHLRTSSAFSMTQSMQAVSASTSAGSTAGNIPIRSWLRPSFR